MDADSKPPRIPRAQDLSKRGSIATGTDISVTLFSVLGAGRNKAESDAFEQERCIGTVAVRPCSVYRITRAHPISNGTKKS